MADHRHIALIGMMAVGKTTVGRVLAETLGRPFVDNDASLVESEGLTIAEIFEKHGEAHFRDLEQQRIVEMLARPDPIVFSLGGGAIVSEENRIRLKAQSFVVWLRADPKTLVNRIGDASTRPLLAADPEGALRRLDEERRELYAQTAHYAIEVDRRTPRWVAASIARRMRS